MLPPIELPPLESRPNGGVGPPPPLITLAPNRTQRKNPLDNFETYKGGWDFFSSDYWAVGPSSALRPSLQQLASITTGLCIHHNALALGCTAQPRKLARSAVLPGSSLLSCSACSLLVLVSAVLGVDDSVRSCDWCCLGALRPRLPRLPSHHLRLLPLQVAQPERREPQIRQEAARAAVALHALRCPSRMVRLQLPASELPRSSGQH